MAEPKREIGIVGLGKMGANLALLAITKGIRVVGNDRSAPPAELSAAGMVEVSTLEGFRDALEPPRAVFLYVPAGPAVDVLIDELIPSLEKGDVIVDAGNSYWGDSIRRHRRLAESGLELVDLGTSGGISGARHGACFMAGGKRGAVERIEPILIELAVEGGYVHAGPPGAGHFTKLVHNGIEFGMLEAIAEGVDLLEHYQEKLDIPAVLGCWRHGSVIRSWLVDLMHEQYFERDGLAGTPSYVEDTGEVNWLVDDAMRMEVSVPVIAAAVMQLIASRDSDEYAPRAIAQMRHGFGGHPFGEDEGIKHERREGRVGGFEQQAED
jgi:6-phosphogluconate dehydrogenase